MAVVYGMIGSKPDGQLQKMSRSLFHRGACDLAIDLPSGVEGGVGVRHNDRYLQIHRDEENVTLLLGLSAAPLTLCFHGKEMCITRDPAGERSVYYLIENGTLLFASEVKALLASGISKEMDPGAVAQFFSFSFVPGRRTMFRRIKELCPGETLTFRNGQVEISRRNLDPEIASESLVEVVDQAIESRLRHADHPVAYLSGGLDSSLVVARLSRQVKGPLKTFTAHFGRNYPNELDFAELVAKRHGTDHRVVDISPKHFLPRFESLVWHLDEPIGDPVTVGNFELARLVGRESDMIFNGEGGDPCFGGPKNIPMLLSRLYPVERTPRFLEHQYLLSYRRCFDVLGNLFTPEFKRQFSVEDDLYGVLTPYLERSDRPMLKNLLDINMDLKGAHLILPKVERMTAYGRTIPASPLFDRRVVAHARALPITELMSNGQDKLALKRAFQSDVPSEILRRPKSGMRVPVHYWLQKDMKKYARKILDPVELRRTGIFNPEFIKPLLKFDYDKVPGRFGIRLWMLLTFEQWRRQFAV